MSGFDSSDDDHQENTVVDTSNLTVDWLDLSASGCTVDLGVSALPGCRFKETWRSLKSDIDCLKKYEIEHVFTLCTKGELKKYRVSALMDDLKEAEINVHHHPFPDGQTPSMAGMMKILDEIRINLMQGRKSLVHCYGGLGRSCLVVACLLLLLDAESDAESAITKVKTLRGPAAIQSVKQYNFINEFREMMIDYEKSREEASRSVSR